MTEARVPVTVEDREVFIYLLGFDAVKDEASFDRIRKGKFDGWEKMQRIARHRLAGVAAGREEGQAEILRLRGLLIDPGDPAWEDARSVLVAELRKAEMQNHAHAIAEGQGAYIPSWIALNLIAHASKAAIRQMGGE